MRSDQKNIEPRVISDVDSYVVSRSTIYPEVTNKKWNKTFIYKKKEKNMATLTALKFSTPEGAEQMLSKIQSLQKMELIKLQDAAIVTWPAGKKSPKTQQLNNLAGVGAMQGAFWGMLFGLIFFVPVLRPGNRRRHGRIGRQDGRLRHRRQLHQADP